MCIDGVVAGLACDQSRYSWRYAGIQPCGRDLESHALPLAYGGGILVCPTNAGAVLAIDLLTHSLVWAHSYRKVLLADANQPMQMQM